MKRFASLLAAFAFAGLTVLGLEKPVVISVYQGPSKDGDFAANLDACRTVVEQARARGSHFVAFPEGFLTGFGSPAATLAGARSLDDPGLRAFVQESTNHAMVVLVGLARLDGPRRFDTVLVIHRGRLLGRHDKIRLSDSDRNALGLSSGAELPVFEAHGVRFGVLIGEDAVEPQVGLAHKLQGAEVLFSIRRDAATPEAFEARRSLLRNTHVGLATLLRVAVARAGAVAPEQPSAWLYGDSAIFDPAGTVLGEAGLFRTDLRTALLAPTALGTSSPEDGLLGSPGWLRSAAADLLAAHRPSKDPDSLRAWLENMAVDHRFTRDEMCAVTGLDAVELEDALRRWELLDPPPRRPEPDAPLRVLPYPGGRHPRLGFFDGARNPQRETKISVFAPWTDGGYVVVDVPEAVFSNLGLVYLAHTHIPTVWESRGMSLPRLEWTRTRGQGWEHERTLPNGIAFGARVDPGREGVRLELWLRNGTSGKLTGLRVQNCVMLGAATGFRSQTIENKVFDKTFAAARSVDGKRWVVTAWERCGRTWGNPLVPCIHSDPVFPDCPAGETVRVRGWLSFHEGTDVAPEIERLAASGIPGPAREP